MLSAALLVSAALPDFAIWLRFGGRVDARLVKGQAQLRGKLAAEFQVAVGLRSAQAVVQMGGVKHEPQLLAARSQNAHTAPPNPRRPTAPRQRAFRA